MFSRIITFIRCLWDYIKYTSEYKKDYKVFLAAVPTLKYNMQSFESFKRKWYVKNTVLDVKRLRYLAKIAIEVPDSYFVNGRKAFTKEDYENYLRDPEHWSAYKDGWDLK